MDSHVIKKKSELSILVTNHVINHTPNYCDIENTSDFEVKKYIHIGS